MEVSEKIAHIAVVTNLSAASGAITATISSWILAGKPDLSLSINGILSGLVAVTASCAFISYSSALFIGSIAGILVVLSVYFLDTIKIDDPVGAISVHLVNGIWGTLAVGLFSNPEIANKDNFSGGLFITGSISQLAIQILGILTVGIIISTLSIAFWYLLKNIFGLRVSKEEELLGLDIAEHGMEAYNGFLDIDAEENLSEEEATIYQD
jgi:Amt family ammonium transporter